MHGVLSLHHNLIFCLVNLLEKLTRLFLSLELLSLFNKAIFSHDRIDRAIIHQVVLVEFNGVYRTIFLSSADLLKPVAKIRDLLVGQVKVLLLKFCLAHSRVLKR